MTHRRSSRFWWLLYGGLLISYVVAASTITILHLRGWAPQFQGVQQIWWGLAIPFLAVAVAPWLVAMASVPVIVWANRWQERHNRSRRDG